jgi:hypothetical protein
MTPFQLLIIPLLSVLLVIEVIRTLRIRGGRRLVGWLRAVVWLGGIALVASPDFATVIAQQFGIGRGADFVFYLSVVAGAIAMASFYRKLERLERDLAEVVRRLAVEGVSRPEDRQAVGSRK